MSLSKPASRSAQALALASRYAGLRARSTQEVVAYLARRGISLEATRQAVAACQARGLLDDSACARLWAEQWARQGFAWAAIRAKLAAKGVSDEVIARAARHTGTASTDDARARLILGRILIGRRQPVTSVPQSRRLWASLARRLASRGFDHDTIQRALEISLGNLPGRGSPTED